MNQFSLDSFTPATLLSFNPRSELHGADKIPAADLKLQIKSANTLLSEFGSQLRDSFYWNSGEPADQGELIDPAVDKPNLRNPGIGVISLELDLTGYQLTIDHGLGGKSNLVLGECEVNQFRFEMQEGGTVIVTFRVQCHPTEKDSGKLCAMIQSEVPIMLMPPDVEELQEAA